MNNTKNTNRNDKVRHVLEDVRKGIGPNRSYVPQQYPPGHYYSPIPDVIPILKNETTGANLNSKECIGIDIREDVQLNLLDKLASYYKDISFPEQPNNSHRYFFQNTYLSHPDAVILFGMLRHFKPKKLIEVGSGFSSALILDTNGEFFNNSIHCTFIEPYPDQRVFRLLKENDRQLHTIIDKSITEVDLGLFEELNKNDILFIDSSHIVKTGSDVSRIIFEILPRLKPGVIIHFHDIYWPFEYPIDWLVTGRSWNEAYFLKAFLQYNNSFEILYFNSFMDLFHKKELKEKMPLCLHDSDYHLTHGASSLWIRKKGLNL